MEGFVKPEDFPWDKVKFFSSSYDGEEFKTGSYVEEDRYIADSVEDICFEDVYYFPFLNFSVDRFWERNRNEKGIWTRIRTSDLRKYVPKKYTALCWENR